MRGGEGPDKLYGGMGDDFLVGYKGVDKLYGGSREDLLYPDTPWFNPESAYPVDDYVHGGMGDDYISGTMAPPGGVDRFYGDDGDGSINASQRYSGVPVSKAIVDCGPGTEDVVRFDEGVDVVMDNCEIKIPS